MPIYFLLIDGHALAYRAYHAFKDLSTGEGLMINAVYGFSRILLTGIRNFKPKYVAVAFDHPRPTFRHTAFENYKANRVEMPDDLKTQIEMVKQVVKTLNIPQFEIPGYEADDLIGTITAQLLEHKDPDLLTEIVTGDRDAFQLVDEYTHVWMAGRTKVQGDTEYDRAGVKNKMGVYPEQIVDLKALMGDASDNIPGVKGIGEKTAVKLISAFGTLEKVYEAIEGNTPDISPAALSLLKGAVVEKLQAGKESAFLSQKLATIDRNVPLTLELDDCQVHTYDKEAATQLFQELEFKSLIPLLPADEFELGVQAALF